MAEPVAVGGGTAIRADVQAVDRVMVPEKARAKGVIEKHRTKEEMKRFAKPIVQRMTLPEAMKHPLASQALAQRARRRTKPILSVKQGWDALADDMKGQINACLEDAAIRYNCPRSELVWQLDGGVIRIKKKEALEFRPQDAKVGKYKRFFRWLKAITTRLRRLYAS